MHYSLEQIVRHVRQSQYSTRSSRPTPSVHVSIRVRRVKREVKGIRSKFTAINSRARAK